MIRLRLCGEDGVDMLIRGDDIIGRLEAVLLPLNGADADSTAPYRHLRPGVKLSEAFPSLAEAILAEHKALHALGLPVREVIVWGGNKVRANPGPQYVDPRDPDDYTKFGE